MWDFNIFIKQSWSTRNWKVCQNYEIKLITLIVIFVFFFFIWFFFNILYWPWAHRLKSLLVPRILEWGPDKLDIEWSYHSEIRFMSTSRRKTWQRKEAYSKCFMFERAQEPSCYLLLALITELTKKTLQPKVLKASQNSRTQINSAWCVLPKHVSSYSHEM